MKPRLRRLVIVLVGLAVILLNVLIFDPDPGAWVILIVVDSLLALFLLGAWRRVRQDEIDRENFERARSERTWE